MRKYDKRFARQMYDYFREYSTSGAPSFSKFARLIGVTLEDLMLYRRKKEFERAFRECNEIRRDYLIDAALSKKADGSFAKFILSSEFSMSQEPGSSDSSLSLTLHVLGDEGNEA